MLFTDSGFLTTLIVLFCLYYSLKQVWWQVGLLLGYSLLFYASNNYSAPLLLLLLLILIVNTLCRAAILRFDSHRQQKTSATLGVIINLSALLFFKYSPLISTSFLNTEAGLGAFLISVPLPVGISFFTFQSITLLVDTFKAKQNNTELGVANTFSGALQSAFYIIFFPQLVAGPIVKAQSFLPQIEKKYFKNIDADYCFKALVTGFFLKVVIANNLERFSRMMEEPFFNALQSLELSLLAFGYSIRIYADFAGYSLIAIGLAGLFGYRLPQNFNYPYISKSVTEFWKRWHMTLSAFLKEYLYIPLGGNRKGSSRTYINLMTVMLLGGLWHGGAWSYMLWGGLHGVALVLERLLKNIVTLPDNPAFTFMKIFWVFFFVSFAWLLFRFPEMSQFTAYLKALLYRPAGTVEASTLVLIIFYTIPVVLAHLWYFFYSKEHRDIPKYLEAAVYGLMITLLLLNSGPSTPFVYFQF